MTDNVHLQSLLGAMLSVSEYILYIEIVNIFQWCKDHLDVVQSIILVQYIVGQQVAMIISSLVKHVRSRGWGINLTNI